MAVLSFTRDHSRKHTSNSKHQTKKPSSWDQIKNLLSCKQVEDSKLHRPVTKNIYTSCSKVCTTTTRVVGKRSGSESSASQVRSSGGRGVACTGKGMQLRKLSGCYECHFIVDPPLPRTNIFCCSKCGEVFPKVESLELHQLVKHAVTELGQDDSSRNIVEIIFKSSWLKNENPVCHIERILKVHNTQRTIQRFEGYRDSVKLRAKRNARCAADGNELLRFHAATLTCSLGAGCSSSLCGSIPACGVCTIIRHGFQRNNICTTASSGGAHDGLSGCGGRRAMLVCRVIAGRVKPRVAADDQEGSTAPADGAFDSLAGCTGVYSTMEELYVFSSRAILPCFVVIYKCRPLLLSHK